MSKIPDELWLQRITNVLRPEQYVLPEGEAVNVYIDVAQGFGHRFISQPRTFVAGEEIHALSFVYVGRDGKLYQAISDRARQP